MVTDEQLRDKARGGDQEARRLLVERYDRVIGGIIRDGALFLMGAEREDLHQEGRVGLLKAVRDYKADAGVPFRSFAVICISREMISRVKMANAQKHKRLNDSVRDGIDQDGELIPMVDLVDDRRTCVTRTVENRFELARLAAVIRDGLSDAERVSVVALANGETYKDLEERTGMSGKTIDNALQRARKKLAA